MCAYEVTLAVGNAHRHDTGKRIQVDCVAPSKLDAAVIAEQSAEYQVSEYEYPYATRIVQVNRPATALALAA